MQSFNSAARMVAARASQLGTTAGPAVESRPADPAPEARSDTAFARASEWLFAPLRAGQEGRVGFWFGLSLVVAALYALPNLMLISRIEYIVPQDARQHVFWLIRAVGGGLSDQDVTADYFQAMSPPLFAAVYLFAAQLGVDPIDFSNILPFLLAAISIPLCFRVSMSLFPLPMTAFLSTALLNQSFWMRHDIGSGTPRAFVYQLLLAFMLCLLRRSYWWSLAIIVLQGLLYPQLVPLLAGVLALHAFDWSARPLWNWRAQPRLPVIVLGFALGVLVLVPHAMRSAPWGPTITGAQARGLPEFQDDGRSPYFLSDPLEFWLYNNRSSFVPKDWWEARRLPPPHLVGLLLPLVLALPATLPLLRARRSTVLLAQWMLVSVLLYGAAHLLLFRLHLPARFVSFSLRLTLTFAAAILITAALAALTRRLSRSSAGGSDPRGAAALALSGAILAIVLAYPFLLDLAGGEYPGETYEVGRNPALYRFLAQQPPDIMIASMELEAENVPTFARRSVLITEETGIPYHQGYYQQYRERALAMLQAQYSEDPAVLRRFIADYGIDLWLISTASFDAGDAREVWWRFPLDPMATVAARLEAGRVPALAHTVGPCTVFQARTYAVLDAGCILRVTPAS